MVLVGMSEHLAYILGAFLEMALVVWFVFALDKWIVKLEEKEKESSSNG